MLRIGTSSQSPNRPKSLQAITLPSRLFVRSPHRLFWRWPKVVHMVHPLVHGGIFCISFHFNDLKQYRGSGGPKPRNCAPLEPRQKSSTFLHLPTLQLPRLVCYSV